MIFAKRQALAFTHRDQNRSGDWDSPTSLLIPSSARIMGGRHCTHHGLGELASLLLHGLEARLALVALLLEVGVHLPHREESDCQLSGAIVS
jgi:hypothetical protein